MAVITGTSGRDTLTGGSRSDTILGLGANDRLSGGGGNDRLVGSTGRDELFGGSGNDRLSGDTYPDRLYGGLGDDAIGGGTGDDVARGGDGDDRLLGENGRDWLLGDSGNDWLSGGEGNDRLQGGDGDDVLEGGSGADLFFGNQGADRFVVEVTHGLLDRVFDLDLADGDILDVSRLARSYRFGDDLAGFVRLRDSTLGTTLYVDADGGGDELERVAFLRGTHLAGMTPGQLGLPDLPPELTLISKTDTGVVANGPTGVASAITEDGRFAVFDTTADNLVSGISNVQWNLIVRDNLTGSLRRASFGENGEQPNAGCFDPGLSDNGRFIAFESEATNLVEGAGGSLHRDVFLKDLVTGKILWASEGLEGEPANAASFSPAISGNGRFVAFESSANNLVEGDSGVIADVFIFDRVTHSLERVSTNDQGDSGNGFSQRPSLSADGRFVAFDSIATNLDGGQLAAFDVFVKDRQTGDIRIVSTSDAGAGGNSNSTNADISADGRFVAFESLATNLMAGPNPELTTQAFVKDMQTGDLRRASESVTGEASNGQSFNVAISDDGRFAVFQSLADNLVQDDDNGALDCFVKDLETGAIVRLTVNENGQESPVGGQAAEISGDGRFIIFEGSNLTADDTTTTTDVYMLANPLAPPPDLIF